MNTTQKQIAKLTKRKAELEQELDELIEKNDIIGWAKKRQEFHRVSYELMSARQYLQAPKQTYTHEYSLLQTVK